MAKKYGFTDLELSKLKTELRQQIIAYTKLTKNQKKFDQKRSEMRLVDAVKLDNAYKDQARQLHNTLYQLKSKALRKARKLEVEGWKVLEELASAEEFSKVDQDLLQDEIKKHVLDTKKFHHQHNEYQRKLANGLKSGKMEPEEYVFPFFVCFFCFFLFSFFLSFFLFSTFSVDINSVAMLNQKITPAGTTASKISRGTRSRNIKQG